MNQPTVRRARPEDLDRVNELLEAASLPTAGVADHLNSFLVAESSDIVIGAIGLELYGQTGLLRSAVVDPTRRNGGVGSALYKELLKQARGAGARRLILLTTTAEEYFRRKGFQVIDRATINGPVTNSEEFRGGCPASAVCMQILLE